LSFRFLPLHALLVGRFTGLRTVLLPSASSWTTSRSRNKQIATVLVLSVKTVESHRTSAMRKLGLKSLPDLVRFAIRNRIVEA